MKVEIIQCQTRQDAYSQSQWLPRSREAWGIESEPKPAKQRHEWWWLSVSPETRIRVINTSAEIASVLQYTEDYDEDFLRPTEHALSRASHLIRLAM